MLKLAQIKRMFRADQEHSSKWRKQAREDFQFYSGDQWDYKEKLWLEQNKRAPVVFNRTATIINTVAGNEVQNREEIRFHPVEEGDIRPNEILDSAAQWFRKEAHADDSESDAFLDNLICGMGWTETIVDFNEDTRGTPSMDTPHPCEMYWDCSARKKGLRDSTRFWRVREMSAEDAADIMDMDPKKDGYKLNADWVQLDTGGEPKNQDHEDLYLDDGDGGYDSDKKVVLVQLQIKERITLYKVMHNNQEIEMEPEEYERFKNRLAMLNAQPPQAFKTKKKVWRQYWIGADILEKPAPLSAKTSTFKCLTGYRDRNSGLYFGMISLMRDPQKWANKWLSQILHILDKSAKGGIIMERGAVEDEEEFKQSWARLDEISWVNDGMMDRVQEKPIPKVPNSLFSLMEFAITSIREASGVNVEMLGQRSAVQAMGLEQQRKEAGLTILAPVFDSLRAYRIDHGKLMLEYIKRFLNDGRLIRIVGEGNAKYVPLALDQDMSYDITVDEAPTSPHLKEKVWAFIMPMIDKLPPQVIAQLLPYSPLPGSVVEKIQQILMQMSQPKPEQQQATQLELAGKAADVEMTKAAAMNERAQAQRVGADLQLEAQKQATDAQLGQMSAQNDMLGNIINLVKGASDGEKSRESA